MLKIEIGDIITDDYPVFCQQVNCKGAMGAGLAKFIRDRYPEVYREYKYLCTNGNASLGNIQCVNTSDNRVCINMFSQYGYGRDGLYTNYEAFSRCLNKISSYVNSNKVDKVAFPMFIGCGLAGGNWNVIHGLLKKFSDNLSCDVILVKLEK